MVANIDQLAMLGPGPHAFAWQAMAGAQTQPGLLPDLKIEHIMKEWLNGLSDNDRNWFYFQATSMMRTVSYHVLNVMHSTPDGAHKLLRAMQEQKRRYCDVSKMENTKREWDLHYNDPLQRAAYIYLYYPAAVVYTAKSLMHPFRCIFNEAGPPQQKLRKLKQLPEWKAWTALKDALYDRQVPGCGSQKTPVQRVRVLSLGGGAGSEIVGFQLFVEWMQLRHSELEHRGRNEVSVADCDTEAVVVDRYSEWARSARDMLELKPESARRVSRVPGTDIESEVVTVYQPLQVMTAHTQTDIHYVGLDLGDASSGEQMQKLADGFQPQVVIMAKAASVLMADEKRAPISHAVMARLLSCLRAGCLVVLIDNNNLRALVNWFQGCLDQCPDTAPLKKGKFEKDNVRGPFVPPKCFSAVDTLLPAIRVKLAEAKELEKPGMGGMVPLPVCYDHEWSFTSAREVTKAVSTIRLVVPISNDPAERAAAVARHWYNCGPQPGTLPPMEARPTYDSSDEVHLKQWQQKAHELAMNQEFQKQRENEELAAYYARMQQAQQVMFEEACRAHLNAIFVLQQNLLQQQVVVPQQPQLLMQQQQQQLVMQQQQQQQQVVMQAQQQQLVMQQQQQQLMQQQPQQFMPQQAQQLGHAPLQLTPASAPAQMQHPQMLAPNGHAPNGYAASASQLGAAPIPWLNNHAPPIETQGGLMHGVSAQPHFHSLPDLTTPDGQPLSHLGMRSLSDPCQLGALPGSDGLGPVHASYGSYATPETAPQEQDQGGFLPSAMPQQPNVSSAGMGASNPFAGTGAQSLHQGGFLWDLPRPDADEQGRFIVPVSGGMAGGLSGAQPQPPPASPDAMPHPLGDIETVRRFESGSGPTPPYGMNPPLPLSSPPPCLPPERTSALELSPPSPLPPPPPPPPSSAPPLPGPPAGGPSVLSGAQASAPHTGEATAAQGLTRRPSRRYLAPIKATRGPVPEVVAPQALPPPPVRQELPLHGAEEHEDLMPMYEVRPPPLGSGMHMSGGQHRRQRSQHLSMDPSLGSLDDIASMYTVKLPPTAPRDAEGFLPRANGRLNNTGSASLQGTVRQAIEMDQGLGSQGMGALQGQLMGANPSAPPRAHLRPIRTPRRYPQADGPRHPVANDGEGFMRQPEHQLHHSGLDAPLSGAAAPMGMMASAAAGSEDFMPGMVAGQQGFGFGPGPETQLAGLMPGLKRERDEGAPGWPPAATGQGAAEEWQQRKKPRRKNLSIHIPRKH